MYDELFHIGWFLFTIYGIYSWGWIMGVGFSMALLLTYYVQKEENRKEKLRTYRAMAKHEKEDKEMAMYEEKYGKI